MPAAIAIVINDGAGTPVSHTFSPIGKDEKGVTWFEQTTPTPTTPLEAKRIGYRQTRSTSGDANRVSKVVWTLQLPRMETLGNNSAGYLPPPTLAYRTAARLEFDLPERGLAQERIDTRVLVRNLLSVALMTGTVDTLAPIY